MRKSLTIGAALLAGLLPFILCGCSGSGAPAGDVEGASLQTLAADKLSALTTIAGWTNVFYMEIASVDIEVEEDADTGVYRLYGTMTDDAAFEYFINPDNSSHGTIKWPNGEVFTQAETVSWSEDYSRSHEEITNTYPNGGRLQYTVDAEYGTPTRSHWAGTATLPDGRHLTLQMERVDVERDDLVLSFTDGARLQMSTPTDALTGLVQHNQETTGTYRNSQGQTLTFRLSGDTRWNRLDIETPQGTTGSFTLGESMEGAGELRTGGEVAAALRWNAAWSGLLDVVGASQVEVTPSAAARDFRIDQWTNHAVGLGPQPVY